MDHPRLGIIIAKKNVKLAVERNRLKRQLRETYRKERQLLPNLDLVVLAKKGADSQNNALTAKELTYLWQKLKHKAQK